MERKVIRISRKKLLGVIIVAIIALVWFASNRQNRFVGLMSPEVGVSKSSVGPVVRDYYEGGQPNITDTREFLKTSYSAEIKTRDIREVIKDVKSAVREAEGRIDSIQSSEKSGYISFVVPKSKFDSFRDEIAGITHQKLYTENISSENLLSQKQTIEEQLADATASLANLEKQKSALASKHTQTSNSLRAELIAVQTELNVVRQNIAITENPSQLNSLRSQEASLVQREVALKQNQDSENRSYATQNQNLVYQIDQVKNQLVSIEKTDTQFTGNIETVSGYVSVNWISFWEMAKIFSPIHPIVIIIVVVLVAWYYLGRKNYLPKIELV